MIGSGFFVANDKIATNIHILADADLASLHVRTDNANYTIQGVTAFDAKNDLVILQISGEGTPLVLGNSDAVSSGETVFCIGYIGYPVDKFNATDTESAIQLDTENPYAYHTRGVAKAKLDDYTAAIDDFSKTISLKSDFAEAYYNRAVAKQMLGQKDAAKVDFEKAAQLDQDEGK